MTLRWRWRQRPQQRQNEPQDEGHVASGQNTGQDTGIADVPKHTEAPDAGEGFGLAGDVESLPTAVPSPVTLPAELPPGAPTTSFAAEATASTGFPDHITIRFTPQVSARTVEVGSAAHEEARRLQAQRFAQVQNARGHVDAGRNVSYVETTDYAPHFTIPIAVYRVRPAATGEPDGQHEEVIATARIELAGATLIEHMIRLAPHSAMANAFSEGKVAEIGGFAAIPRLDRATLLDAIDAVIAVALRVATAHHLDGYLIFPRNGFMSIMRAAISGLLPPYRFHWSPDVLGWQEGSEELARFRALELRGLGKYPDLFYISASHLAEDLATRQALLNRRHEYGHDLERLLTGAMVHAQRDINREVARGRDQGASRRQNHVSKRGRVTQPPAPTLRPPVVTAPAVFATPAMSAIPATSGTSALYILDDASSLPDQAESEPFPSTQQGYHVRHTPHTSHSSRASRASHTPEGSTNFLPFDGGISEAEFLHAVVTEGGSPAQTYKEFSYQLLDVQERMHVLDIGCGEGSDLLALARLVGEAGTVIGVDREPTLVATSRENILKHHLNNAWVYEGDAEHLTFAAGEFDRVRADRAVQHMRDPEQALAEMWRILKPNGVLTIIEPDWPGITLYPASAEGSDDDQAFQYVLAWCRQHLAHPLIGRQLHALLRRQGQAAWSETQVIPQLYAFTDWQTLDIVLRLSQVVAAIQADENTDAATTAAVTSWLEAVHAANDRHEFFAAVPLFFAYAAKAAQGALPASGSPDNR